MILALVIAGINLAFGNCETNGANFSYAPDQLMVNGHYKGVTLLSSNDYALADWWPVTDVKPACASNEEAIAVGWSKHAVDNIREDISWIPTEPPQTNEYGDIIFVPVTNFVHYTTWYVERTYRIAPLPPPTPSPRRWTPLSIKRSATSLGAWDKLKVFLESAGAYDDFLMAQYEAEDDVQFSMLMQAARKQFGDKLVDDILNGAEVEP